LIKEFGDDSSVDYTDMSMINDFRIASLELDRKALTVELRRIIET
jgi:hypothetical protein